MSVVTYNFPTRIRFGNGARHELVAALRAAGSSRPLLVTDRGVAALPFFGALLEATSAQLQAAAFSAIWGNPVASQVAAGVAAYRAHDADAIVAVGGGAPVDVAKAIALMVNNGGELFDYEDRPGARTVEHALPPIIAIPTTAGTGSEVGRSSVISDDQTHAKKIIFDPQMLPDLVLADPELLLGLPASITAATGIDALTHLLEAYVATGFNPFCDGIALEGIRLVVHSLEACVGYATRLAKGEQLDANAAADHLRVRGMMLNASMMGATAFQKGLGVIHSCAHALSTVCDTHHGLANAVMLRAGLAFNLAVVPERMLDMARAIAPDADTPETFPRQVASLCDAVGIPKSLTELGVSADDLDRLVEVALADGCHLSNPRPVTATDFRAIFMEAFQ